MFVGGPSFLSYLCLDAYPVSSDISHSSVLGWANPGGPSSMAMSLIPLSSSLIAPYANRLQHERVKRGNSTIILSGNIDSERTFFIAPLGK